MRIALFVLLLTPTAPRTVAFDIAQGGTIGVDVQVVVVAAPGATQVTSSKLVSLRGGRLPDVDLFRAETSSWRSAVATWGFLTSAERDEVAAVVEATYADVAAQLEALLAVFPVRVELTPLGSGLTGGTARATIVGPEVREGTARYSDVSGDFSLVGRTGVFGRGTLPATTDVWGLQGRPALGAGQWTALATLEGPAGAAAFVSVTLVVTGQVRLSRGR